MQVLLSGVLFIINFIISAYLYILSLRLLMQKFRVSWYNPISQFIIQLSNPVIKPIRRFIPGFAGFDGTILLLIFVFQAILIIALEWLSNMSSLSWLGLLSITLALSFQKLLNTYLALIIVFALMSWFSSSRSHPLFQVSSTIIEPGLAVIQRRVRPISGFDLSPVIMLVLIQLIKIIFLLPVIQWASSMGG